MHAPTEFITAECFTSSNIKLNVSKLYFKYPVLRETFCEKKKKMRKKQKKSPPCNCGLYLLQ